MLSFRALPYPRDKFLVRGTELAVAVVAGTLSRFAVYEVRTLCGPSAAMQYDRAYMVRDAATVSDEAVRAGQRPKVVARFDDERDAEAFCVANINAKLLPLY